jgi:DNA-directed RNA polymerase subunit M/transcription elongation factor TFIIS
MVESGEAKHELCPSCKQMWLKLVEESEETIEDTHGVRWPATEYYQCERCKKKWARDVASNTWSEWSEAP